MQENFTNDIQKLGLADDVVVTGYVSDAELSNLYRHCFSFVYPTWYEGFGLPVLEAMNFGRPVIASDVTSIPEITGDAAILTTPGEVADLVNGMISLEQNKDLRMELVDKMPKRLELFSWDESAKKLVDIYRFA